MAAILELAGQRGDGAAEAADLAALRLLRVRSFAREREGWPAFASWLGRHAIEDQESDVPPA